MSRIVVGLDGSDSALKTLAWAMEEAEVHHWDLHVVTVLEQHPVPSTWGAAAYLPVTEAELDALRANAQRAVDDLIAARHRPSTVPVRITTASGQPAAVLIRESETAEHLVVGCRGIGGFGRLLLGSVSNQVVHHAVCPVTIIHHEWRPGSPDGESSRVPQPDAQNGN
jgi:nucleotide-binding universal stress UspA family protein